MNGEPCPASAHMTRLSDTVCIPSTHTSDVEIDRQTIDDNLSIAPSQCLDNHAVM
jgi:hypothetical protein